MKLETVKNKVLHLLENVPSLRDDDNRLILNVWALENPNLKSETSFKYFANEFAANKLSSTESIRRVRQKMQELHPHLRGQKWIARHKHQESIKEELKQM